MAMRNLCSLLVCTLAQTVSAFVPPASVEGFRSFLVGQWTLRKVFTFKTGGLSGRFEGTATFMPFAPLLLSYNESGSFTPDKEDAESRDTRNSLIYGCSTTVEQIDVFFDQADSMDDADEIMKQAKFLYSLSPTEPGTLVIESTADGSDTYSGALEISAADAYASPFSKQRPAVCRLRCAADSRLASSRFCSFLLTWRVQGPQQDGTILSLFSRSMDQVL